MFPKCLKIVVNFYGIHEFEATSDGYDVFCREFEGNVSFISDNLAAASDCLGSQVAALPVVWL